MRQAAAEIIENMSVSDESEMTPSEIEVKKNAKLRKMARNGILISRKVTGTFFGLSCFFSLLVGLSPLFFTVYINTATEYCTKYESAMNGDLSLSDIP